MAPTDQALPVSRGEFALFQSGCAERHRRENDQWEAVDRKLDSVRLDVATLRGSFGGATKLLAIVAALGSLGSCGVGIAGMMGGRNGGGPRQAATAQPTQPSAPPAAVSVAQPVPPQDSAAAAVPSSFWALNAPE